MQVIQAMRKHDANDINDEKMTTTTASGGDKSANASASTDTNSTSTDTSPSKNSTSCNLIPEPEPPVNHNPSYVSSCSESSYHSDEDGHGAGKENDKVGLQINQNQNHTRAQKRMLKVKHHIESAAIESTIETSTSNLSRCRSIQSSNSSIGGDNSEMENENDNVNTDIVDTRSTDGNNATENNTNENEHQCEDELEDSSEDNDKGDLRKNEHVCNQDRHYDHDREHHQKHPDTSNTNSNSNSDSSNVHHQGKGEREEELSDRIKMLESQLASLQQQLSSVLEAVVKSNKAPKEIPPTPPPTVQRVSSMILQDSTDFDNELLSIDEGKSHASASVCASISSSPTKTNNLEYRSYTPTYEEELLKYRKTNRGMSIETSIDNAIDNASRSGGDQNETNNNVNSGGGGSSGMGIGIGVNAGNASNASNSNIGSGPSGDSTLSISTAHENDKKNVDNNAHSSTSNNTSNRNGTFVTLHGSGSGSGSGSRKAEPTKSLLPPIQKSPEATKKNGSGNGPTIKNSPRHLPPSGSNTNGNSCINDDDNNNNNNTTTENKSGQTTSEQNNDNKNIKNISAEINSTGGEQMTVNENEIPPKSKEVASMSMIEKGGQQQPVGLLKSKMSAIMSFFDSLNLDSRQHDGSATEDVDAAMEEFLRVPFRIEELMSFGSLICADSFLHILTVTPLKFVWSCICLLCTILNPGKGLGWCTFHRRHLYQLLRVFVIYAVYKFVLSPISIGKMYHWIRGQAMLKLYVLMAMVEVFDRLMCSFGCDALDSLFWNTTRRPYHPRMILSTLVVLVYAIIHSYILFVHVATLNVAMNSADQTLLALLISGNFAEIKSTVFKKYNKQNLFKIVTSDICERFKLVLFLGLVLLLNCAQGGMNQEMVNDYVYMSGMIILAEMLCDWIKHSFITKFNFIKSSVYQDYALILAGDITGVGQDGLNIDHTHTVVKRIGFAQIPLACVMARYVAEAARYADTLSDDGDSNHVLYSLAVLLKRGSWSQVWSVLITLFVVLLTLKGLLGRFIERRSHCVILFGNSSSEQAEGGGIVPVSTSVYVGNKPRRQAV